MQTWIFRAAEGFGIAVVLSAAAWAQVAPQQPSPQPEMTQQDEPATFRTHVNLVMVPVVVRDKKGQPVGNLKKEDFQLFDKGKPQEISRFSVEKPSVLPSLEAIEGGAPVTPAPGENARTPGMAERFIGYLFDDVHAQFGDLAPARDAAERNMTSELRPTDRAAIFTTSGQGMQDFTDDLGKLHEALQRLQPRPIVRATSQQCPDISFYMADLIINKNDAMALQAAAFETIACVPLVPPPDPMPTAMQMSRSEAQRVLAEGNHETQITLAVLMDVIRRMAAMPGQRTLILASPGFTTLAEHQQNMTDIIDRAIRGNVVINALDIRGLYVPMADASQRTYSEYTERMKTQYRQASALSGQDVLAEFTSGTGGAFVRNSNDMAAGFRRLATVPDYYYVLGFSPQNLKPDGSFHGLKVTVKGIPGLDLQARHGYYAPRHTESAAETAQREIEDAMFSREEMHDMPVELRTQFFKPTDQTATVAVLAHVDLKHLRFRKAAGRNTDELTVISGLFDRNGNYVTGITKHVTFNLKDGTLERRMAEGITIRTSLNVKPGTYIVRLVVRDSEGEAMSAANGAVDIP